MNYFFDDDYHTTTYCHYRYGNLIPGYMVLFLPSAFRLPLPLLEKSATTTPRFHSYYFYYDFDISLEVFKFCSRKAWRSLSRHWKNIGPSVSITSP